MTDQNGACIICGEPLRYFSDAEKMTCAVCGKTFESNAKCLAGHYVCDECHTSPAVAVIKYICSNTKSKNPVEIAKEIMNSPFVHTHGPEYHIIVGSSLLAAYKNAGGKGRDFEKSLDDIRDLVMMAPTSM